MPIRPPHPEPATTPDHPAEDTQYYRRVLHELIDMGADLARAVHQQATAPQPDPAPDLTIPFDRIARAIRRTVALARRLAEPVAAHAGQHRIAARRRIIREVEDAIGRRISETDAGALHAELAERLDAPEFEDELDQRPVADIVADICRDLGIAAQDDTQPWRRRTPADVAGLCARAAAPYRVVPMIPATPEPAAGHPAPSGRRSATLLQCTARFRGKPAPAATQPNTPPPARLPD